MSKLAGSGLSSARGGCNELAGGGLCGGVDKGRVNVADAGRDGRLTVVPDGLGGGIN